MISEIKESPFQVKLANQQGHFLSEEGRSFPEVYSSIKVVSELLKD